ncbi:putative methionyl-tRNA synthetase [Hordeum vulgare]|nr:putative methionyl-tRNA synthetase [Hordeum vulgare]
MHGGFNPNTTFLHDAPQRSSPTGFINGLRTPSPMFNADLNTEYSYSPLTYSSASRVPPLHRGAVPFMPYSVLQFTHTDTDMDEIITSGDIDDEIDDAEEEGEEEHAEVESEPMSKRRGKKKRASNAKPADPRVKWTSKEDECLAEVWKTVSIHPITDANQNTDAYWGRIKMAFDECKLVDPDFANIHMDRDDKAMANHWVTIQIACNK